MSRYKNKVKKKEEIPGSDPSPNTFFAYSRLESLINVEVLFDYVLPAVEDKKAIRKDSLEGLRCLSASLFRLPFFNSEKNPFRERVTSSD